MRDRERPLGQHLLELRRRLIFSAAAIVVGVVIAFYFNKEIIELLKRPADDLGPATGGQPGLVAVELTENLAVSMKVALMGGLVLAFPVILYQIVMFVAPGLTSSERRYLLIFMPGVMLAFAGGVAFGYSVLIPPAINFLLGWHDDVATPLIRVSNYVGIIVRLLFWMGVVFETPVVMFLLAKLGIVSWRGFVRWRRYWIVTAFIIGAIITPTIDPVNQALVAGPLIVLYELGILLAWLGARRKPESVPGMAAPGS